MSAWSINQSIRTPLLLLGIAEFFALSISVYVGAVAIYGSVELGEEILGPFVFKSLMFASVMLVCLIATGLYNFHQRVYFWEILARIVVAFVGGTVVLAAIYYATPLVRIPLNLGSTSVAIAIFILLAARYFFHRNVDENVFRFRTLVLGNGQRADVISELRRRADRRGFRVVGNILISDSTLKFVDNSGESDVQSLVHLAKELRADEIVVAMDDRRGHLPIRELLDCKMSGIDVIDLIEFLERETGKIRADLVNPGWLVFSNGFRVSHARFILKRIIDVVVAGLGLILAWPIMILVAVAIKFEDGIKSPVLYRQERVGLNGTTFDVLKFRSMRVDAEADGQAVWAAEGDSRITRTGGVIRKYRLDEIPQIFNVLKGEMSLVGPRPERPEFVSGLAERVPYYSERHKVKPGVTGWAQLRYAYGSSEEDTIQKLHYDLFYVKNHSVLLDLIVILQTVEVVLWGKGSR